MEISTLWQLGQDNKQNSWCITDRTGRLGQSIRDKTDRTGRWKQDSGMLRKDSWYRKVCRGKPGQDVRRRKSGWDRQERKLRTLRKIEHDNRDEKTVKGQP